MLRRCYNVVSLRVRKWKVIDNKWADDLRRPGRILALFGQAGRI